ncbi:class IV adenylate cyclase [Candidatus Saccharibacteria bacterium]|nr:class IV adenylate cyclase [Candidatus Saccharibacteria bacterium]
MTKQELEICLPLKNIGIVRKFLDKNAEFSYENHQVDTYFDSKTTAWTKKVDGKNPVDFWLRIREEGDVASINFKDFSRSHRSDIASCTEFESIVSKPSDAKKILGCLGFAPAVVVDKVRRAYKFHDVEIALDRVMDLGDYIEIEYYGDKSDVDEIRQLLNLRLLEINAETGEYDEFGYPYLMLMKKRGML